jgi:FkbM family methyltransferase
MPAEQHAPQTKFSASYKQKQLHERQIMFAFELRFKRPQTIVQVGAHSGNDALIAACRQHGHRLYMFEPNPRRVAELEQKAAGSSTVFVIPQAVSNAEGRATFNIANYDDCSSLHNFAEDANQTWVHEWHPYKSFEMVQQVDVEVVRLDSFMKSHEIATIDFLIIDAQGEDLRVVESLGERTKDVKKVQMEINIHSPLYQDSFGMNDAMAKMSSFGFDLHAAWKQSLNREVNAIFRSRRFYPNALVNKVAGFAEQHSVSAYQGWQKLPRVLAVTRMMIGRKLTGRGSSAA